MLDRRPAAVLRCSDAGDVMEAVDFVREHDLPATVRGGGHSGAGLSVADGAVTLDLSPMRWAHVVSRRRRASSRRRASGASRSVAATDTSPAATG
jgi:FAD/FMN-containing dehydrogenase